MTILGARPQFIKAAVLSRAILANDAGISESIIHTGQHFDENMSEVFFDELDIPRPDYNLGVRESGHGRMTGRMLAAIEDVLQEEKPQCVVVYGDTNSTLAGALAAAKLHIPVAHIEAGLRSFNKRMPEEVNRVLSDHVSRLLFCPTENAVNNLKNEGLTEGVCLVGDVMYDAALYYAELSEKKSSVLQKFELSPKKYILATIHRAENTDDPENLRTIFSSLTEIGRQMPVVVPLHPRTRKCLEQQGLYEQISQTLMLTGPLGYLDMVMLEKNARLIVTDSGGVQKEAFFHETPCVTIREETEWVELVQSGWNTLCPPHTAGRIQEVILTAIQTNIKSRQKLFGDGYSGEKIVETLKTQIN